METFFNKNDFVRFSGIKQNRPALHLRGIAKRKIFLFSSLFVSSLLYAGDNPCGVLYALNTSVSPNPALNVQFAQNQSPDCVEQSPTDTWSTCSTTLNATQTFWNGKYWAVHPTNPAYCNQYGDKYSLKVVSSCPVGTSANNLNICGLPHFGLSSFDNDPVGCSKAGGTFMSIGTQQVGGTSYGASFFGGSGIVLGGEVTAITKCGTPADVTGEIISTALNFIPLASIFFKAPALKKMANMAMIAQLQKLPYFGGSNNMPDYHVGLPKLPSPEQIAAGNSAPTVPITPKPVPEITTPNGTGPSRAPEITVDLEYSKIDGAFIPTKTTGDPVIDYSIIDRYNNINAAASATKLESLLPEVGTTTKPVKQTFDLSQFMPDSPSPSVIAHVPQTTTKTTTYDGADPVVVYNTARTYPDGSQVTDQYRINTATRVGTLSSTSLAPTGETTTVTTKFSVPDLVVTPTKVSGTLEVSPSTPPISTSASDPSPYPISSSSPDLISAQDPSTIINAVMPSYSLPSTPDFIPFDSNPITELVDESAELFQNINDQITSTKMVFDNTLSMIQGGWNPPPIPPGSCGDSLAVKRGVKFCSFF
ncbi:hypothetical protein E0765_06985 [Sulfuricurvum sp. IAE1]|uniref:hypothetical protein n=1 Tax=Sulfuricurvum sp. IAE1 TaxID=2546102 RepID=UPI00105299AB|nr:hypothetical protein [Sulfuricurvum sp. IAE1]TDA63572.1 hypothetical protein E0765_06985 [Sulfuricurvum sp. IAE1]